MLPNEFADSYRYHREVSRKARQVKFKESQTHGQDLWRDLALS